MANVKFTNNAASVLTGSLTTGSTTLNVTPGDGAKFPSLSGSEWFPLTLVKLVAGVPTMEIVRATARSTDAITITRAQESTTALTFAAGDKVELRLTAAAVADLQLTADDDFLDKGTVTSGTVTFDKSVAACQRLQVGGALTIATSNWATSGNLSEMVLELVNGAAFAITWPTINWVKTDGSYTTSFASNGVTLQTSGTDWVLLWTRNGGTTIMGKVMR